MFCPNCGAKALDNAEFCQSCGAKLIVDAVEKKQLETSAWQTQVQPRQYPTGAPEKKKGKKWPIILGVAGVLLCLLVILAVMGGNDSSKNQSQENSTEVNLSETDTNEEESTETSITDDATLGSDLLQGYRIMVGETQTIEDEFNGSFEVTLDYVELADVWQGEDPIAGAYTVDPEQDNVFLCAGVTVKNIGKKEGGIISLWNTLLYDGAYEFRQSYQEGNNVNIPPLSPPETAVYAFQIPISAVESDKSLVLNIGNGGGSDGKGLFFILREGADGSVSMPGNAGTQQTYESEYMFDIWNLAGEYEGDVMPYSVMYLNIYSSPEGDIVGNYNITFPNAGIENKGELRRDADKAFSLISNGTVNGTIEVVSEAIGEIVVRYIDYTQEEEYLEYNYYMYTAYPMP